MTRTEKERFAVRTIAARAYRDFERWQGDKKLEERVAGFECMMTGISALRLFGFADTLHMASGRKILEVMSNIRDRAGERPWSDPNKIPTQEDIAASRAWQDNLEQILQDELAPQLDAGKRVEKRRAAAGFKAHFPES